MKHQPPCEPGKPHDNHCKCFIYNAKVQNEYPSNFHGFPAIPVHPPNCRCIMVPVDIARAHKEICNKAARDGHTVGTLARYRMLNPDLEIYNQAEMKRQLDRLILSFTSS